MCRRSFRGDRVDLVNAAAIEGESRHLYHRQPAGRGGGLQSRTGVVASQGAGLYFNAGNGPGGLQDEWNVKLDPQAYQRVFESGLPLYWCPCFGQDGYQTYFVVDQRTVVSACSPPLQNFFVYCLTKSQEEPIAFLSSVGNTLPEGPRNMWCTGPLYHAAGRRIYQRGPEEFVALTPQQAQQSGLSAGEIAAFTFQPFRASLADPKPIVPAALTEPAAGRLRPLSSKRMRIASELAI